MCDIKKTREEAEPEGGRRERRGELGAPARQSHLELIQSSKNVGRLRAQEVWEWLPSPFHLCSQKATPNKHPLPVLSPKYGFVSFKPYFILKPLLNGNSGAVTRRT